jgi:hypothetical protein
MSIFSALTGKRINAMNFIPSIRNLWFCITICLLTCLSTIAGAVNTAALAKGTVEKLYRDYAWVVLIDDPEQVNLIDQPERELSKYFTDSLSKLIIADRRCAAEAQDICNLDFDPIYDSQDPDGAHQVRIEEMNASTEVKVTFLRRWSSSAIAELRFKMINTSTGWRIDDIYYSDHESIRSILQRKKH